MAASDKRELILDLLARDKTGQATASAGKNLSDVGDKAEKASTKLGLFGRSSEKAEDAADDLGDETDDLGKKLAKLDAEIKLAEHELKGLARAFADTDDAAQRLDIAKVQRKLQRDIRNLTKNKSLLKDLIPDPDPKDTRSIGTKIVQGVASGVKGAAGPMKGAFLVSVIGALAPEAAGLLAAAVVGGVGIGGIIGGAALAAKNPQIQAYAKQIGGRFSKDITAEAEGSFLNPLQKSLTLVDAAAQAAVPKIGKIFQSLGPELEPLTADILAAGNAILDAFVYTAARAHPVMESLGKLTRSVGNDAAGFIEEMADHSDAGAKALDHLTDSVHLLMSGLTPAIGALAETYSWLDKLIQWAGDVPVLGEALHQLNVGLFGPIGMLGDMAQKMGLVKKSTEEVVPPTKELTDKQKALQQQFDDSTRAAQGEQDALDELSKQLKAQTDPVFGLLNAQDKLAAAQKNATEVTKKSGSESREAKAAYRELAEAALDVEGAAGLLGDQFDGHMTPALEATLRSAGLTQRRIDQLKEQFNQARKAGQQFARNYKANLQVTGTDVSAARVAHVRDLLAQVRSKKISVSVLVNDSKLNKVNDQLERIRGGGDGRATGGSVAKGVPYWVGEGGRELFVPDQSGRMSSASSSRGSGDGQQSGGGQPTAIRLELAGSQEVVSMFRYLVRTANLIQ